MLLNIIFSINEKNPIGEQGLDEKESFLASLIRGVLGVVRRAGKGDQDAHQILDDWYEESQEDPPYGIGEDDS